MLWRAEGGAPQPSVPPDGPLHYLRDGDPVAPPPPPPVANVSNALRIAGAPGRKLVQDCVAAS